MSVEASYLTEPNWQGLASRQSLLLAVAGHNPQSSLASLATATGHPEVAVAPFVPYGLSAGGRRSVQTAVASPGRTLAVLAHHPGRMFAVGNDGFNFNRLDGSVAADTLFDFAPAFPVPILFFAGEQDNLSGFVLPLGNFEWGRARGQAPWTFICEPATSHTGQPLPPELTTALLEGLIVRRLPASNWPVDQAPTLNAIDVTTGYLGDTVTGAALPYAAYTGDRSRASWLPDATAAALWSASVRGLPWVLPPQPISLPTVTVNLQALDAASARIHPSNAAGGASGEAAWKICGDLKEGDLCYVNAHGGAVLAVPASVRGAEWIRPHPAAGSFSGTSLARFEVTADANVLIAHDSRIATKPAWLTGYTDTGESMQVTSGSSLFASPVTLQLYRKSYSAGQTVDLGPNGTTPGSLMYLVVVKPVMAGSDEPTVSVVTSDSSAAEAGPDPAAFTLTRSGSPVGALSVFYTVGGSATAGVDFVALSGSAVLLDGVASVGIVVAPIDDLDGESAETVELTLVPGAGYSLGASFSSTVTIADNDGAPLPSVSLSASVLAITEGEGATFALTLSRTGNVADPLTVSLSVTGNAGYGSDYEDIDLNVTIPAGAPALVLPVGLFDDTLVEGAETATFTVLPTTAYTAGSPASVSVQIDDDDGPPAATVTLSVAPTTGSEDGSSPAVFTLTRSGALTASLTVSLGWAGTAQVGADVGVVPVTVEIPAGLATVTVPVAPLEDVATEGTETLVATVLASPGVEPGAPGTATYSITDNDNSQRGLLARQIYATPASGALRLDIYTPRGVSPPFPAVITLFGGGWQTGSRSLLGIASLCNSNGMACIAIDYRLTGTARWPAQIHDVKAAVRWLRAHAAALGLDPDRLGLFGHGSGGHLALVAALTGGEANVVVNSTHTDLEGDGMGSYQVSDRVRAACSWFAPTDLLRLDNAPSAVNHNLATSQTGYLMGLIPPPPIAGTAIQTIPERTASGNPALFADAGDPPILIMHGTADTVTPLLQAEQLYDTLIGAGVRATLFPIVGAGSSFPTDENNAVVAFFRRELGVSLANQPPNPVLQADVQSGPAPLTVVFDGSASFDTDGSIIRQAWSFGDNTGASGPIVSRQLSVPGRYRVTLGVEDDGRALASTSVVVEVLPASNGGFSTVAITSPAPGTFLLAPAALHLQAEAVPAPGTTIAAVDFFVAGSFVGRDTAAPYGVSVGGLRPGTVALTAQSLDRNGQIAASETVNVTVLSPEPEPVTVNFMGNRYFGVHVYRSAAVVNRVDFAEASNDLEIWEGTPVLHETVDFAPGLVRKTYRAATPLAPPAQFLRVVTRREE